MRAITFALCTVLLFCASNTGAVVAGFTGITLESPPTADRTRAEIQAVVPLGTLGTPENPAPDVVSSTARMTGFSTGFGSVVGLDGPRQVIGLSTVPEGSAPPDPDPIRNIWGFEGQEIDGSAAILGPPNVGAGLDNAGAGSFFDVRFGVAIVGQPGAANDLFLMDIIGDDAVELRPLDAAGNPIGDLLLTLQSGPGPNNFGNSDLGDFGLAGFDLSLILDNSEFPPISQPTGIVIDDVPLAGIAFDIEDFAGSVGLDALYGLRITPIDPDSSVSSGEGSIDLVAVGYALGAAEIPVRAIPLLGLPGLLVMVFLLAGLGLVAIRMR